MLTNYISFKDAMLHLEAGGKVTRKAWVGSLYFKLEGAEVKSYEPTAAVYQYDENIMISDGWIVENNEGKFKFYDIIPFLQDGLKAWMEDWKDMFIYYDAEAKTLILFSMKLFRYAVDFDSLVAKDWVVLPHIING